MACSTFDCSSRTASAWNEIGGSIAVSETSCRTWFGIMSRSAPGMFVVAAAPLDAETLGDRDLHVIDIAAVPDRLENAVGEPKDQDVLNGFFARDNDRCDRSAIPSEPG